MCRYIYYYYYDILDITRLLMIDVNVSYDVHIIYMVPAGHQIINSL